MNTVPMILIPDGVEPVFEGDHDQPIWSLYVWRPVDDDADTDDGPATEWLSDGDGGEFYQVAHGLTHAACERLAQRLGLLPA